MNVLAFYSTGLLRQLVPYAIARRHYDKQLRKVPRYLDQEEINWRVEYYNGLTDEFDDQRLQASAISVGRKAGTI